MKFEKMLSPGKIGSLELRNRLIVPAMETEYTDAGKFNKRIMDYWIERAKGGWALLTVEVAAVSRNGKGFPDTLTLYDDDCIPMYKKLTDEVHKHGSKMSIQLHHAGRQTISSFIDGLKVVAPSPIANPLYGEVPKELTTDEVYQIIEDYGDAAVRAKKSGFDAVEIHSGHGYLPIQFLSSNVNKRTDEFGGDLEARAKFAVEIIKNIKKKNGSDYPVIIRISGEEHLEDGITIEETKLFAPLLEEAGVDAINVSNGAAVTGYYIAGPMALKPGYNVYAAEAVKSVVKIPVIAVGKLNEPYLIESVLQNDRADFVAIGRGSIADPYFPQKISAGLFEEITPCISCNQKCLPVPGVVSDVGMSCLANPFAGREHKMKIESAVKKKNIVVIGAGPAGLEFASIASQRGHHITVYEKGSFPGGQFALASIPPTKQPIAKLLKHLMYMGQKNGVKYKFNTEDPLDEIISGRPDAVVLATGSVPLVLDIKGIDNDSVVTAVDILAGKTMAGKKVVVLGGGSVGVETADFLAENQHDVTVLEMRDDVAIDEPAYAKVFLMQRLAKYGVKLITNATVTGITENGVIYDKNNSTNTINGIDTIVLAFGVKSYNPFVDSISKESFEVHSIGDAAKCGDAVDAILSGAELAVKI
ncbi:MAG: NAD(P)/FAD-dependent oxidoreductase [Tannerella sp.]|jgi:2,4-dienoyl-CoA reductase-like NADH-dependent reductase (Old Yellow Enzyme family)/thioredoxin reductase|nr:NAD(P)/FAD-dependent oxidoreductase [Tannerella sp.]